MSSGSERDARPGNCAAEAGDPADPSRCPLCGEANACGMAEGASTCWCFETSIPAEVLERVPEAARGVACVCRACATRRRDPARTQELIDRLVRRR
ncbi:cysteine-rich CWC family protein [Sorangium sp. So ce291]|uniref:cysteine-rich CWC family protein n=1 Tax=Sorangium sp. So ce291 TaxID=3133294 RepID=UPI003F618C20